VSGVGKVVQSTCDPCEVVVHWKVAEIDRDHTESEPLDVPTGFVCDHWRDHHEATGRAPLNPSGRAYAGTVSAKVLSAPPST
jgi:hypothetical protein